MNPIIQTKVTIDPDNNKVIQWYLRDGYNFTSPINFYVDWARSGGDWINIAGPLSNVCTYTDAERYNWNKDRDLYYRVRFTDSAAVEHVGEPARAGDGFMVKHDYLIFRDILRKECLVLHKGNSMKGEYLRRKHWGTKCPVCLDFDTDEVTTSKCAVCFGTGFVGGYYESVKLPVSMVANPKTDKKNDLGGLGTTDDQSITVRTLAFPYQDSFDLWTHYGNNDRYVIRQINPVSSYNGIIIAVHMKLQKLPYTDIVYQTPVDVTSQEDLVTPGLDNGWRPNLEDEY